LHGCRSDHSAFDNNNIGILQENKMIQEDKE